MVTGTVASDTGQGSDARSNVRSRDADGTRRRLLEVARRRFARDGYAGTTVRQIAGDAGVNVALINRYFDSKEGLFEACLTRVIEDLGRPPGADASVETILESILSQADLPAGEQPFELLLLLRSSGDERADDIRRNTLKSFAEGMATVAGWRPGTKGDPGNNGDEVLLLRAQIALAVALGMTLLRASTALEPLASATAHQLRGPLGETLTTLLSPGVGRPTST